MGTELHRRSRSRAIGERDTLLRLQSLSVVVARRLGGSLDQGGVESARLLRRRRRERMRIALGGVVACLSALGGGGAGL